MYCGCSFLNSSINILCIYDHIINGNLQCRFYYRINRDNILSILGAIFVIVLSIFIVTHISIMSCFKDVVCFVYNLEVPNRSLISIVTIISWSIKLITSL